MTPDIERIAREAGGRTGWDTEQRRNDPLLDNDDFVFDRGELARFAQLIAAECATIAEHTHPHDWAFVGAAIRNKFGA
jgi:hypothetical protein